MSDADTLVLDRAERDFEDGLAYARESIRKGSGRLVAASLDALVMGAVGALELRQRMREDVRFLIGLAHRVAAGEDPARLAEENLARVLRLKQLALIAREKDPEFRFILDVCRENFAKRLPDLARMVTVPEPKDYEEVVRRAFPEQEHVVRLVQENREFTLAIVAHFERHPDLLRAPRALVPRVAAIARDMIEWQTARVLKSVDEIYDFDPPV